MTFRPFQLPGIFLALTPVFTGAAEPKTSPQELVSYLNQHCYECHDEDVAKADLNLYDLAFDPESDENFKIWQRVFQRVREDEMPPAKVKDRPKRPESKAFMTALRKPLIDADRRDIAQNGRVLTRRLTRVEYEHTIHDLLGVDVPLVNLLPEDPESGGFETVAEGQQLSHHQLARYLDVADLALADAFKRLEKGDVEFKRFCTPKDLAKKGGGNYRGPDLRDGRSISWPLSLQFFGRMPATTVPADGWYRITLKDVQAINPGPEGAVWGTLRSGACGSSAPMLYMVGLVEATKTPRDVTFEAWIQDDHMLELKPNDASLRRPATGAKGGNVSFVGRDLEKDGYSGIANRGIQIERIYPYADRSVVRSNLLGDVKWEELKADPAAAVETLVPRFASRAFRRPVTAEQSAPYREIAQKVIADGASLNEALRIAYRAVLCSPRFLTFVEAPGALDDYAIVSRLSYALWTSMPDWTLTSLAKEGKLKDPKVLVAQVERMLKEPKADRFIVSFTDQWLKMKLIDFTTPDPRQFKTFDTVLQESMLAETRAFVAELIEKDLGIDTLIDSDFAFLNGRLARHYNLNVPVKPGNGLQKVSLPGGKEKVRGGLLTQGAVLKVTADGTHTSPVVRGVFVNERILGVHIPPPPPGVPAIEPDIRGAISIRDQLDKHRNNESCASCHRTIDPPGFVLESFDPIGGWRTKYGSSSKSAKVDPSGTTPEGDAFTDLQSWKNIYTNRDSELAVGFTEKFLTYATGAAIRFSDEAIVAATAEKSKDGGYGIRSLIRNALLSPIFLKK